MPRCNNDAMKMGTGPNRLNSTTGGGAFLRSYTEPSSYADCSLWWPKLITFRSSWVPAIRFNSFPIIYCYC
jgi:hypothetical protein